IFLFGPRQTGKSTLLRSAFPEARFVDLLHADTFRALSARPELLRQRLTPEEHIVIIDEVQKIPALLDEVHALIESRRALRFILTGSSARKLRRGHANLLAGRAWTFHLHPLTTAELPADSLAQQLTWGRLPAVFDSPLPHEDLRAYVGTYLREEIQAEGAVRALDAFSRFLDVAGLCQGQQLNYSKLGSDCGVSAKTIREYFQILEDTLLGYRIHPLQQLGKRKAVQAPKFYLFDLGVARALRRDLCPSLSPEAQGLALEHLVFVELRAYLDYRRLDVPLTFYRTRTGQEVDFIVGNKLAIEVKRGSHITRRDSRGLRALRDDHPTARAIIVCQEAEARRDDDGIDIWPMAHFCQQLWADALL
ncbi:MAG: ATP-binding protein, partial [Polyangiales bacterium]